MNEVLGITLIAMLTVGIFAVVRHWLQEIKRFNKEEA